MSKSSLIGQNVSLFKHGVCTGRKTSVSYQELFDPSKGTVGLPIFRQQLKRN